jgi:hypothetical protein
MAPNPKGTAMTAPAILKLKTEFRTRIFGLPTALALAAAASLTAPAPAAAIPVTWTISGSDTFFQNFFPKNPQRDTFSGSFVFDTSTMAYSAVEIVVSGP